MNTLVKGMTKQANKTYTQNGMKINKSSNSAIVDLFFAIGASRGKDILPLFQRAVAEDMDLAIRVALYARDVREGMGERKLFRDIVRDFAHTDFEAAKRVVTRVPDLGRFDDLFAFVGTPVEKEALDLFQFHLESGNALAAKWAPREKSANRALAAKLRKHMGLKPREYRKMLANATTVVETQMCAQSWGDIEFSHVPSVASARYQRAFLRNDEARYRAYLGALEKGDPNVKINAGAVYPYDIVRSLYTGNVTAAQEQWKALPDWIPNDRSFVPLIDVSGSMGVRVSGNVSAMDIAVSLGLYCAQNAKSAFKDKFITFTSDPSWIDVGGMKLKQAVETTRRAPWGMSTDVEKAYELIVNTAVKYNVPPEDMPEFLIIFSDMQFNSATRGANSVNKNIRQKFEAAGYEVPKIVYWNLRDYGANTPVEFTKDGVALVSGFSPSLMKSVLSMDTAKFTPLNIVLETVMKPRYDW